MKRKILKFIAFCMIIGGLSLSASSCLLLTPVNRGNANRARPANQARKAAPANRARRAAPARRAPARRSAEITNNGVTFSDVEFSL